MHGSVKNVLTSRVIQSKYEPNRLGPLGLVVRLGEIELAVFAHQAESQHKARGDSDGTHHDVDRERDGVVRRVLLVIHVRSPDLSHWLSVIVIGPKPRRTVCQGVDAGESHGTLCSRTGEQATDPRGPDVERAVDPAEKQE